MRYRSLFATFFAALLLLAGPPITAQALPGTGSASGSGSASPCHHGVPPNVPKTPHYYDNLYYLGPDPLPQTPPVSPLLVGYQRFGNYTEAGFIAKYHPGANYIYPPDDGFVFIGGQSTAHPEQLAVGMRLDRFGGSMGKYLSPVGVPFAQRALSPSSLNSPGGAPQSDYHVYCVQQSFRVDAGPATPWFGQPGLGKQFVLNPSYLPGPENAYSPPCSCPNAPPILNVQWLIDNGYLVEEIPQ